MATQALMANTIANGAGPGAALTKAQPHAASPAGAPSPDSVKDPSSQFGCERIVDIIRREQANQIQQARQKGTPKGAQKVAAVPHGSGEASSCLSAFHTCTASAPITPVCALALPPMRPPPPVPASHASSPPTLPACPGRPPPPMSLPQLMLPRSMPKRMGCSWTNRCADTGAVTAGLVCRTAFLRNFLCGERGAGQGLSRRSCSEKGGGQCTGADTRSGLAWILVGVRQESVGWLRERGKAGRGVWRALVSQQAVGGALLWRASPLCLRGSHHQMEQHWVCCMALIGNPNTQAAPSVPPTVSPPANLAAGQRMQPHCHPFRTLRLTHCCRCRCHCRRPC